MTNKVVREWLIKSSSFHPVKGEAISDHELDAIVGDGETDEEDLFIQIGTFGKQLSDFLKTALEEQGLRFDRQFAEDYAHILEVKEPSDVSIWLECSAEYDRGNMHQVSLRILRPFLKGLFSKALTETISTKYTEHIEQILKDSDDIQIIEVM